MKCHEIELKCTNSGHLGRLAVRNTGARAGPGLGHSNPIVIPLDFLSNPLGLRVGLGSGLGVDAGSGLGSGLGLG